jgi:hypothetical protein
LADPLSGVDSTKLERFDPPRPALASRKPDEQGLAVLSKSRAACQPQTRRAQATERDDATFRRPSRFPAFRPRAQGEQMGDSEQRQVDFAHLQSRSSSSTDSRIFGLSQPSSTWPSSSRTPPSWPKTTEICGSTTAYLPVRPCPCTTARQTAAAAVSPAVLINTTIVRFSSLGALRRTADYQWASRTLLRTRRVGSYNGTSTSTPTRCRIANPTLLTLPSRRVIVPSFRRACIRNSGRPANTARRSRVRRCHHRRRRGQGATRPQSEQGRRIRSTGQ